MKINELTKRGGVFIIPLTEVAEVTVQQCIAQSPTLLLPDMENNEIYNESFED